MAIIAFLMMICINTAAANELIKYLERDDEALVHEN